jgi:hypothetical protein
MVEIKHALWNDKYGEAYDLQRFLINDVLMLVKNIS